jgi:hypothetical protein
MIEDAEIGIADIEVMELSGERANSAIGQDARLLSEDK